MDTIIPLRGAERVRLRPDLFFGSNDREGAEIAATQLITLFLHEAAVGGCCDLQVWLAADGTVTVHSADRGMLLEDTLVEGRPLWEHLFCELYVAARNEREPGGGRDRSHRELYGEHPTPRYGAEEIRYPWISALQFVAAQMEVTAVRDGVRRELRFAGGDPVGGLQKTPCTDASYTRMRFIPDPAVFSDTHIRAEALAEVLQAGAVTIPGLVCTLTEESTGRVQSFCYPEGVVSLTETVGTAVTSTYFRERESTGRDRYNRPEYSARVRLALRFVPEGGETRCYHNLRRLDRGGRPLRAVWDKVVTYLNWQLERDGKQELTRETVAPHCVLVLESACTDGFSRWESARPEALSNPMMTDMAADLVGEDFGYFVKQNQEALTALFNGEP